MRWAFTRRRRARFLRVLGATGNAALAAEEAGVRMLRRIDAIERHKRRFGRSGGNKR
ncbi:MAG TPA: hypothetical protein VNT77_07995 [Allosphingosinicella sp.]|nr:hypothetical protein [Allosphingosinicella sp.]